MYLQKRLIVMTNVKDIYSEFGITNFVENRPFYSLFLWKIFNQCNYISLMQIIISN